MTNCETQPRLPALRGDEGTPLLQGEGQGEAGPSFPACPTMWECRGTQRRLLPMKPHASHLCILLLEHVLHSRKGNSSNRRVPTAPSS